MLSANYLRQLDNTELVRIASHEVNDLTSTPLEVELLARLERYIGSEEPVAELLALVNSYAITTTQVRGLLESHPATTEELTKLLALLNDHDIHDRAQLEKLIAFSNEFRALASDAGDAFERLSTFATNAIKE